MRFAGRILRAGRFWAIEVPLLGVATQGRTRAEAFSMIADAVESLVNRPGFRVEVHPGPAGTFELGAAEPELLVALMLRRLRARSRLSLAEVARRLGAKSHNAYARYEQGASVPTVAMLQRLLRAVSPDTDLVLTESQAVGE